MAFEKTISLKNCRYDYTLSPTVKKFTLKDNTFFETKVGVITNLENNKIKMKEIDKFNTICINAVIKLLKEKGVNIELDDIMTLRCSYDGTIGSALIFTGNKNGFYYEFNYNKETQELAYEEWSKKEELNPRDINYLIFRSLLNNANTDIV